MKNASLPDYQWGCYNILFALLLPRFFSIPDLIEETFSPYQMPHHPSSQPYCVNPSHIRVFIDDNGDWYIDGVDPDGLFTEGYEVYGSEDDAVSRVEDFASKMVFLKGL